MVSSAPSSPSLGARRGDPGGQLLQELEALSQALYRSTQQGSGPGQFAAPPPPRKEVPSPIRGGGARKESLPPAPRASGGHAQAQQQQQQQGKSPKGPGPVPHLSLGGHSATSRGAHLRHAESEVLKNFDQHIGKAPPAAAVKPGERVLQPWHSQGFEKNLPQVTNFPAWLEDNLNFSKKLEAPLEKKSGWRNWKPFRALAQIGQQKFNCIFTVHVHAVEGLPPAMNGMRLAVSCKRKDSGAQTGPVRVFQGSAEFEETLNLKSVIYGSKEGKGHAIKYMSKSFTLSVVALDADELVLGKHRLDLSRLLPETFDGNKVDENKPSSWTTSFQLSGKAKGGNLVASFAVEILDSKEFRNTSNTSARFMESPTRRAVRSFSSLPNSAHGTPRMRPSDVNLSPALSEPDLSDYLGIEHLSLDETMEDKSYKIDSRPKGIPRGGSDMRFKAFAQQLEGKLKVIPQKASIDSHVAPPAPKKSESVPEPKKEVSTPRKTEESYGSSEDDDEFVVEDRGTEMGTLPESVHGRSTVEQEPDLRNRPNSFEDSDQEEVAKVEHPLSVLPEEKHTPVVYLREEQVPVLELPSKGPEPQLLVKVEEPVGCHGGQFEGEQEEEDDEVGKEVSSLRLELERFEKALNIEIASDNVEAELHEQRDHGAHEEDTEEPLSVTSEAHVVPGESDMGRGQLEDWRSEGPSYNEKPGGGATVQYEFEAEVEESPAVQTQNVYEELLARSEDLVSPHDLADEIFLDPSEEVADLDDEVDLVAGEFLDMLENEPAPSISGSDSNSPRALLLKRFERESMLDPSMSMLGFGDPDVPDFRLDDNVGESMDLEDLIGDLDPLESGTATIDDVDTAWDEVVEDAELAVFMEVAETELKKATQAMRSKSRAKAIEDEETEALMAQWGLDEKAFESSPPKKGSHAYSASFSNPLLMRLADPPALAPNIGSVVATRDGGSLRSMSPMHFQETNVSGKLVMQVSRPVVVPAEMGSSTVDILRRMAASGMENMALHAMMAMPLEDISGKSVEQVASEGLAALDGASHRNGKSYITGNGYALPPGERVLSLEYGDNNQWGTGAVGTRGGSRHIDNSVLGGSGRWGRNGEIEAYDDNISLEELAPVAMQKIESLAMEGLKIQADVTDEVAPYNVDAISWEHLAAIEGAKPRRGKGIGMLEGVAAMPLVEGVRNLEEKQAGDIDGLMSMAISLEEWMRLDAGVYDEPEASENTLAILAAHHAVHKDHTDLVVLNQKSDPEKARGRQATGAKASFGAGGCMGDTLTLAMLVQLRDPLKNFEPVGAPMMALVQAERVLIPPKPRIAKRVSLKGNSEEDEDAEKPKPEPQAPVFKITNVTMSGLQTSDEKKKESRGWGNQKQQQSGSKWLAANGMGKGAKHPALKPKPQAPSNTKVKQGESLWSISARVHGTGSKWKEVAALNPHIRNPDVIFANDSIRTR